MAEASWLTRFGGRDETREAKVVARDKSQLDRNFGVLCLIREEITYYSGIR